MRGLINLIMWFPLMIFFWLFILPYVLEAIQNTHGIPAEPIVDLRVRCGKNQTLAWNNDPYVQANLSVTEITKKVCKLRGLK